MEYKQFNTRHKKEYDKLGKPISLFYRREKISILFLCALFIGFILLFYPYVSNAWNEMTNTKAITKYKNITQNFSHEEIEMFFSDANNYNQALAQLINPFENYKSLSNYENILNINGSGMMGYVRIPKINVKLAIFHGFSDDILDQACGHLQGTSFPVGGHDTHAVISAHRGLPSAKLFSELNRLQLGDTFSIEVLNKILYYQVDQIKICDADDSRDLGIIYGEDHVTLLTCTPYGINTHRLLVRGIRTENPYAFINNIRSEAFRLDPFIVCLLLSLFVLLLFLIFILCKYRKKQPIANIDLDELERQKIVKGIGEYEK